MKTQVLNFGYIEFIESWGSDERIIEAARMSTDKGFMGWGPHWRCNVCKLDVARGWTMCTNGHCIGTAEEVPGDEKLLRYLWTEKPQHSTPFEMAGMVIEVQAPIMVFREWHRHRTASYNEMSGRYIALPDLNYVPSIDRLLVGSDGKNKQAGTIKNAGVLDEAGAEEFRAELASMWEMQEAMYQKWLKRGVPKELARIHIGVGRYSRMRASANLLNWLKFMILRSHKKAQYEIRQYSDELAKLIQRQFPRTYALFVEGKGEEYPVIGVQ